MNYQEKYQRAREAGYSDEEIMEYLGKKDPSFSQKMETAQEAGYTPQEVLSYFNTPKEEEKPQEVGFKDYVSDFGKQAAQGIGIGAIGTYGDILDLLGLQSKEILPGEQEKYSREFDILEKMQQGQSPSFGELMDLSDDDVLPRYSRLPTSGEVEQLGKEVGLVSEPKTTAGKYGRRIGKLGGSGLSLGSGAIAAPIVAGAAGQTLEELGAPPWAQAAAEIIATLKLSPKSDVSVSSKSPEVQNVIQKLRKNGFTEQDIALAKNSLEDKNLLKKISSHTGASKQRVMQSLENTEKNVNKIIESSFPGLTSEGPEVFKKASSKIFDALEDHAAQVPVKYTATFAEDLNKIVQQLEKTLAETPQESQVINFLKKAIEESRPKFKGGRAEIKPEPSKLVDQYGNSIMTAGKKAIPAERQPALTADYYTRFYKGLNAIGKWDNPKQREYVFSSVKDAVKDVLKKQGPEGVKLVNHLEEANASWIKYLKADEVHNLLSKVSNEDGINFTKLARSLENKTNLETLADGLGKESASNIKLIADVGKSIKNLDKALTGNQAKELFGSMKLWELGKSVAKFDFKTLSLLIGHEMAGKLATKLLTDPSYQNIQKQIVKAAADSKWQNMAILSRNLERKLKEDEDHQGNQSR